MIIVVIGVFFVIAPHNTFAQTTHLTPFFINLTPTYPQPYSHATISVSSNSISTTNGIFSIYVNKKKIGVGTGSKSISFTTGAVGIPMYIVVTVASNGHTYKQALTIHPASVALVVEPLATAPLEYLGSPTVPPTGNIRLVAIPNIQTNGTNPLILSYVWKSNGQTLAASGVGNDSVSVSAPLPYRKEVFSVLVKNQNGTRAAQQEVTLMAGIPTVYIYKDNPLTGINYAHILSSTDSIGSVESTFAAVPYGFSTKNGSPNILWSLNGTNVQTGGLLTVRPQGVGNENTILSVLAQNNITYESAKTQLSLLFGSNSGSGFGLFGL